MPAPVDEGSTRAVRKSIRSKPAPRLTYAEEFSQSGSGRGRRATPPIEDLNNNECDGEDQGEDGDDEEDEGVEDEVSSEEEDSEEEVEEEEDGEEEQEEEGDDNQEEDEEGDDEGYDSFIEERSRPEIPQPDLTVARVPDSDGWGLIARLGPLSSFLTSFPVLQEVPEQHHQAWVAAMAEVLRRWKASTTEEETTVTLSWFLFLAQSLLRRPSRGGRAGRKEVARRFTCTTKGDWGSLVEIWERGKEHLKQDFLF